MTSTQPSMLTYPARPVNGGALELARPKYGEWFHEPKVNGWRALAHLPSLTLWNRHGEPLSIAREFSAALSLLASTGLVWADVEAVERRHALMRGCLILLDLPEHPGDYLARRAEMESWIDPLTTEAILETTDDVFILPKYPEVQAPFVYAQLKFANCSLGTPFYEGVVAKKATSIYPIQTRRATDEFPSWMKHRF